MAAPWTPWFMLLAARPLAALIYLVSGFVYGMALGLRERRNKYAYLVALRREFG